MHVHIYTHTHKFSHMYLYEPKKNSQYHVAVHLVVEDTMAMSGIWDHGIGSC